ncbi:hypothetical protein PAPYR_3104 [Paratrimastix pyriformis]|uniref:Golgin subfamily A member 7/ERF4 domain-containing protein n=1 Tax=Paratrimastix pyriformis TaxID=342808 RepID=A0ABQ8USI4_9EUKA|nr:hypothetical protein PAPYR_3104 [Paratrimastix pyriformis]
MRTQIQQTHQFHTQQVVPVSIPSSRQGCVIVPFDGTRPAFMDNYQPELAGLVPEKDWEVSIGRFNQYLQQNPIGCCPGGYFFFIPFFGCCCFACWRQKKVDERWFALRQIVHAENTMYEPRGVRWILMRAGESVWIEVRHKV